MPKVLIHYDTVRHELSVFDAWDWPPHPEYDVVVHLKSSHYRNIKRNEQRWMKDQTFLNNFFIEAQRRGTEIREQ
jgi:hypothetical protein